MNGRKDRRGGMIVAVLAVLYAVFATGTPAAAQLSSADRSNWLDSARGSAEWGDQFDSSGGSHMFQAAQSPLLGPHAVPALVAAIDRYQQIVAAGGWEPVPNGPTLRVGVRNRNVAALRRRLATTGDLSVAFREGEVFDSYVEKAVKTYQTRNGITPTGVVDEATLNALNVPANARLAQLRSNLDRFAAMTEDPGERYVVVNIPGAGQSRLPLIAATEISRAGVLGRLQSAAFRLGERAYQSATN